MDETVTVMLVKEWRRFPLTLIPKVGTTPYDPPAQATFVITATWLHWLIVPVTYNMEGESTWVQALDLAEAAFASGALRVRLGVVENV